MTESKLVAAAALLAAGLFASPVLSAETAKPMVPVDIGYVELAQNPMYDPDRAYYMVPVRQAGSPLPGAQLGVADAQTIGKVIGVDFGLKSELGDSIEDIKATVRGWAGEGMHFVIADLPAAELLARVPSVGGASRATFAVDLGCGPGNSTELLVRRFPQARILGVDNSASMLVSARERLPGTEFTEADIAAWTPAAGEAPDLLFANAALQWVPDHAELLPRLLPWVERHKVRAPILSAIADAVLMGISREEIIHRLMTEPQSASDRDPRAL